MIHKVSPAPMEPRPAPAGRATPSASLSTQAHLAKSCNELPSVACGSEAAGQARSKLSASSPPGDNRALGSVDADACSSETRRSFGAMEAERDIEQGCAHVAELRVAFSAGASGATRSNMATGSAAECGAATAAVGPAASVSPEKGAGNSAVLFRRDSFLTTEQIGEMAKSLGVTTGPSDVFGGPTVTEHHDSSVSSPGESPMPVVGVGSGGSARVVLRTVLSILRPTEQCHMLVELCDSNESVRHYLSLVSHNNSDADIAMMIFEAPKPGAVCSGSDAAHGLPHLARVIVMKLHMIVQLLGNGTFAVVDDALRFTFKTGSVRSMWSTIAVLQEAIEAMSAARQRESCAAAVPAPSPTARASTDDASPEPHAKAAASPPRTVESPQEAEPPPQAQLVQAPRQPAPVEPDACDRHEAAPPPPDSASPSSPSTPAEQQPMGQFAARHPEECSTERTQQSEQPAASEQPHKHLLDAGDRQQPQPSQLPVPGPSIDNAPSLGRSEASCLSDTPEMRSSAPDAAVPSEAGAVSDSRTGDDRSSECAAEVVVSPSPGHTSSSVSPMSRSVDTLGLGTAALHGEHAAPEASAVSQSGDGRRSRTRSGGRRWRTLCLPNSAAVALRQALRDSQPAAKETESKGHAPGSASWVAYYENIASCSPGVHRLSFGTRDEEYDRRRSLSPDAALDQTHGPSAGSSASLADGTAGERPSPEALVAALRTIMLGCDLDNVTCREMRTALEERFRVSLAYCKEFIDEQMMKLVGQMDPPSRVMEHLLLGTQWNASNRAELERNGVRYIVNAADEIALYFPDVFVYHHVRIRDEEQEHILRHFEDTYHFIKSARMRGRSVFVHCQMGVSRSASIVIAYAMKEFGWTLDEALKFVKARRQVVKPNPGFMRQLYEYEGILRAGSSICRFLPPSTAAPTVVSQHRHVRSRQHTSTANSDVACGMDIAGLEAVDSHTASGNDVDRAKLLREV